MSIDWITVGAQIVNFLILVWLLKRFLYGPITRAIDEREARIARREAAAEQARAEAEQSRQQWEERNRELDVTAQTLLDEARQKAEALHADLERQARAEVQQARASWQGQVEAERADFMARMKAAASRSILMVARKVVGDLADQKLEDAIARRFERQLASVAPDLKTALAAAGASHATITSSFPLDAKRQKAIADTLEAHGITIPLDFRTEPGEPAGLSLQAGGLQVTWTVDSYLDALEDDLGARLAASRPTTREASS